MSQLVERNIATAGGKLIEVRGLSKRFKNLQAVENLDLDVAPGEFVALLGPNGAGKTTLVEMIEGVQKPDSGEIKIAGKTWQSQSRHLRHILGVSFQETQFMDKVTVFETLQLFASFYGETNERVEELLVQLQLISKRDTYVLNLSGGQKQKLAIAIAMVNRPRVLLLDEPTTGLDPNARREIWDILKKLKSSSTGMILTTHYMEEAEYLCDRILIMHQGRILTQGSLEELQAHFGGHSLIKVVFEEKVPLSLLESLCGVENIEVSENSHEALIFTGSVMKVLEELVAAVKKSGDRVKDLQSRQMTLDDIFVKLTGRGLDD